MQIDGATCTTCPYCGVGCGVQARRLDDGTVEIKGDPDHPANFGRLCSKGTALGETVSLDGRLLEPLVQGKAATWDDALDTVADRFQRTIEEHGPNSVALYVSGQLLTEDYYVANKLMKGFIGTANIDTNSRLCMASSVAGHKRAFGSDTVPGTYEDLELADLVVLVGSNLAWCHPILYQRLAAAREQRGTKVVVIDPRRTATCEIADLHLPIAPGSDVALFNGLLAHLTEANAIDNLYIAAHTNSFEETLDATGQLTLTSIAAITALPQHAIEAFYELFATTERTVTVFSQGVNQSSSGTDKVNAIINCHLATGRIGRPGMGPFSVTGQPNAMGGRETGGLANMLAAHMELADPDHRRIVQSFWNSPRIADRPGLKAVDLFEAVADGRVKAIWIMATNPVDSMPDADKVRSALAACPFVVVSDVARHTDTTAVAHVLLPAAAWGEKNGTVTNSERRISRQRAFLPLPGAARPDWWQLCEVAKRLGFAKSFTYTGPAEIFAEYAMLTGIENNGARDLDISALAKMTPRDYDALSPLRWPKSASQEQEDQSRFFANGNFFTPDRRARFIPTAFKRPGATPTTDYPLLLNTGRTRDQWHTMTRTGKAARLMSHSPEPFAELNPTDANRLGISTGALLEVESPLGRVICRAIVSNSQRPGDVFVPIHWTDQLASHARIDALIASITDPISGQPEAKCTPIKVRLAPMKWHAFAVAAQKPARLEAEYFAIAPVRGGWRIELADRTTLDDFDGLCRSLLAGSEGREEILAYHDQAAGQHRFAAFVDETLVGALYVTRGVPALSRSWLAEQLGTRVASADRLRLLAGRPGGTTKDKGPIVCSCFEVGKAEIIDAIAKQGCTDVASVGRSLKAGTNCGSCRSEIRKLIDEAHLAQAG